MKEAGTLKGLRREMTKNMFEELGGILCESGEILGYIGTTKEKLDRWCRRTYKTSLEEILPMLHQDGLVEIRRASFEAMRKSATLVNQLYTRFLNASDGDREKAARRMAKEVFSLLTPEGEQVGELFEE